MRDVAERPTTKEDGLRGALRQRASVLIAIGSAVAALCAPALFAQETTATIAGVITAGDSAEIDEVDVEAINRATGVATRVVAHRGRFLVPAVAVGGPYILTARRIGYQPEIRDNLFLSVGETLRLHLQLQPAAIELREIEVAANRSAATSARSGVGTVVSDSFLRRLPSLNRSLYDFVVLSPYVTSNALYRQVDRGGVSGAGVNFRFDNFQIDGATAQALNGRNPAGVAPGKPISLEAVQEYEVVLAPYDVSQGDFAGVLVNAVTRSGTNDFHGDAFGYLRNETLARDVPLLRDSPYDREQYGFSLSGPIVRSRLHFFVGAELQHNSSPAGGPYVGPSLVSATPVPVDTADIGRFTRILQAYGLEAGSAGPISNGNPLVNLFARLDLAIPSWNGRLILRHSYGHGSADNFVRGFDPFSLSTLSFRQHSHTNVTVAQLFTSSKGGSSNEVRAEHYDGPNWFDPLVQQPLVTASVPRTDGAGPAGVQAGSAFAPFWFAQGNTELTDNLRLLLSKHRMTLGAKLEFYHDTRKLVGMEYGNWSFSSLDSLQLGEADQFVLDKDFGGGTARASGSEIAMWAGDEWLLSDRFLLRAGIRGELPIVNGHPPYSAAVDSAFGIRTDRMPNRSVLLSPRVGFEWDIRGNGRTRLRGGTGIFVGRPPFAYWVEAFSRYGAGIRQLRCGTAPSDAGPPPPFNPDYANPPQACANGATFDATAGGQVALLAPDLTYPRVLRASLGVDQQLSWGVVASVEGLYTKSVRDFVFLNRGLKGPQGTDRHGRVVYGSFDADGNALPALVSDRFPQVVELRNQSHNHSYELSAQIAKDFSNGLGASVSYTWSRVRDVETGLAPLTYANWAVRPLSGRQDDLTPGISDYDQPHRVVLAATYTAPWKRWRTDLSVFYVGGSGPPFTYVAGDLNADGNANDPIYVPITAFDSTEIRFAGTPAEVVAQQQAFQHLVTTTPCLFSQRGRIMARNSCRSPWVHSLNIALRQGLAGPFGHDLTLELQVFNFLNLLNSGWGLVNTVSGPLLQQVGWLPESAGGPQPIFAFDPEFVPFDSDNPDSYYQLQLAFRYSF